MQSELDRAEVTKVIHDAIGWALTKDTERLFSIVARDAEFFIFHPDAASTVVGFDAFRAMAERDFLNPAFKATDFAVRELRVNFAESGTVAWFAAFLDDHCEVNGRRVGWDNARWTGVLERRAGKWVIVQMHFSLARD